MWIGNTKLMRGKPWLGKRYVSTALPSLFRKIVTNFHGAYVIRNVSKQKFNAVRGD
jgi:hypothetical protein